jgi:hypothetical protein
LLIVQRERLRVRPEHVELERLRACSLLRSSDGPRPPLLTMDFENVGENEKCFPDERVAHVARVAGQDDFVFAVANYFSFIDLGFIFFRRKI